MTDPKLVKTEPARLAFPALFEAKPKFGEGSSLVFSATILFPPDTDLAPIKAAAAAAAKDAGLTKVASPIKSVTKINAERAENGQKPWKGYEDGWHALRVQSNYRPEVVDQAVQSVFNPAPGTSDEDIAKLAKVAEARVYPGCWCRFFIGAYSWKYQAKSGVGFNINAVQLVRDGDRLDGRQGASEVFDAIEAAAPETADTSVTVEDVDDILG